MVTFRVVVTNESVVGTVEVTRLVDDIYGHLAGQGTCSLPQTLAASQTYACVFTAVINAQPPSLEIDRVLAVAVGPPRAPAARRPTLVAQASAGVLVVGAPPTPVVPPSDRPTPVGVATMPMAGLMTIVFLLGALAVWKRGGSKRR